MSKLEASKRKLFPSKVSLSSEDVSHYNRCGCWFKTVVELKHFIFMLELKTPSPLSDPAQMGILCHAWSMCQKVGLAERLLASPTVSKDSGRSVLL